MWDGTLTEDAEIPLETRRALRPHLRPNPARARELERLASDANTFTPEHYWPRLLAGQTRQGTESSPQVSLIHWITSGWNGIPSTRRTASTSASGCPATNTRS